MQNSKKKKSMVEGYFEFFFFFFVNITFFLPKGQLFFLHID